MFDLVERSRPPFSIPLFVACLMSGLGARAEHKKHQSKGDSGGPKEWGSQVTTGLIAIYSQFLTCSDPHIDRCSDPLPLDPLSSP